MFSENTDAPPLKSKKQFANDLYTVSRSERVPAGRLIHLLATPDEILQWYFSQDPLDEAMALQGWTALRLNNALGHALAKDEVRARIGLNDAMEKGAGTIVAHLYYPELFNDPKEHWLDLIDKKIAEEKAPGLPNPQADISIDDVVGFCIRSRPNTQFGEEDLKKIMIAAEMFQSVAEHSSPTLLRLYLMFFPNKDAPHTHPVVDKVANDKISVNFLIAQHLYNKVRAQTLDNPNASPETRLLGIRAAQSNTSLQFSLLDKISLQPDEKRKHKKDILLSLLKDIEKTFMGADGLLSGDHHRNAFRGNLHELIWVLDSQIWMIINGTDAEYSVLPSFSFQDRPNINFPEMNRGFDVVFRGKKQEMPIQLKSKPNPRFKTVYHPSIWYQEEQNFDYNKPYNLGLKLELYRQFIESDFDLSLKPKIEKNTLKSVIATYDAFVQREGSTTVPYQALSEALGLPKIDVDKLLAENAPKLNREQRRKIERDGRRKKSKQ